MKSRSTPYARPALWGFFICIAVAGLLAGMRFYIPTFISSRWESERTHWREESTQIIRDAFEHRVARLMQIAVKVSEDTLLAASVSHNDISAAYRIFHRLNSYRLHDDQTLDLVDSAGNVRVWSGPSITSRYTYIFGHNLSERFVRVTQNRLRAYLTAGIVFAQGRFYLMVSEPLELNSPISNRFVQNVSFSDDLSRKLNAKVTLRLSQTLSSQKEEFVVPVVDKKGALITEFSVEERSLEREIESAVDVWSVWIAVFLAVGCVFLVSAGTSLMVKKQRYWVTVVASILSIWIVRLVWRWMEFPSNLIGGWLFNPNLYASPFTFGLSSSLGELILSIITIAVSTWLFLIAISFGRQAENIVSRVGLRIGRVGSIIVISANAFLILWLLRGVSKALQSFVFDSTIRYSNPSDILLEGTAALMHLNILLLGVSLLCISIALFWIGRKMISTQFSQSESILRLILIVPLIVCIPIFVLLDQASEILTISSIVLMAFVVFLVELLAKWNKTGIDISSQKWRMLLWMVLGSFLIGEPILHEKLQLKEYRDVEAAASEFMRPSDSWLTYIVLDGLHVSAENLTDELKTNLLASAKETNLAFVLWTRTLLGKEGYNSALVIYDQQGNEADRFVVGMSKLEQRDILTRVFEGEEDAVHILGSTEPRVLGKLYGAWMTVRNSNGEIISSVALILSENQRTLFREEEVEPLRQFGDRFENDMVREIALHEYQMDTLVFSTGRKLFPNQHLSPLVKRELTEIPRTVLWKNIKINGYKTKTIFISEASLPGRIVSVSLEELDFRWELFNYLKEFFIYIAFLAVTGLCMLIRKSGVGVLPILGFRGKLFLGFALITLLPLAVLSYYNKQLVAERVQEQVESTLYQELIQLQDRINIYVSDEEDFIQGVDDDFCEAISAEYGADFSIYREESVHASSRPELYRATLLDTRLNGEAYASTVLGGRSYFMAKENIGVVEYYVGYAPLIIDGKIVGVLAIPTLNRQKEFESELAQQNAYVFGIYAVVFGIALAAGGLLSLRFARPLHNLTLAAKDVSEGNLDVRVSVHSRDEIGALAGSFNEMVSKLKTSRAELAKHERQSAWREMAKQVAHEIRNPLTPIKLSVQHIRQAFKDKAADREEILQRVSNTVIDQIDALSRIAAEFSSFARMPESKFERFNIDDLLKETINLFREIQGINFIEKLASPAVAVVADRDQLRGVFINIIRNAIQAVNKTGEITIQSSADGRICIVKIIDTGPGIPEEIQAKIFEPNFSTKTEGMGLGLAIARRTIEDHGGTISCSSIRGKGTTFEIRLPV